MRGGVPGARRRVCRAIAMRRVVGGLHLLRGGYGGRIGFLLCCCRLGLSLGLTLTVTLTLGMV